MSLKIVFGFLMKTNVLGKIKDYVVKIEFQQRGTPHIHLILWVEDAPVYGVESDEVVCAFIDKYIQCNVPTEEEDEELNRLVLRCQVHKCLKSKCKKKNNSNCRYNFPKLPSNQTLISKGHSCDEYLELPKEVKEKIKEFDDIVKKKLITEGKNYENLEEFLLSLKVI